MWVVIHKEKMSIFSGYKTRELAVRSAENLNTIKEKFYVEYVEVRGWNIFYVWLLCGWLLLYIYVANIVRRGEGRNELYCNEVRE